MEATSKQVARIQYDLRDHPLRELSSKLRAKDLDKFEASDLIELIADEDYKEVERQLNILIDPWKAAEMRQARDLKSPGIYKEDDTSVIL